MNSLDQYLKLLTNERATIDAHAPRVLNRLRPAAMEVLKTAGAFPAPLADVAPDLNEMFAPDYGLNISRVKMPLDAAATFRCDIPHVSTLTALVAGDAFAVTDTLARNLPRGVQVMSLARAALTMPELVEPYLNRLAADSTVTAALNTAFVQDGVLIHVDAGVQLDKAIQVVNIFHSPQSLMAVRRILIVAERDSAVKILLCDHSQRADVDYLSSQVVEIFANTGSRVELYDIEETTPCTRRICETFVRQHASAQVRLGGASLSGGDTLNLFTNRLEGPDCSLNMASMILGTGERRVGNISTLHHYAPGCFSRQLFKYALFDRACGTFGGKVFVHPGAVHTDAAQTNRNLLAAPDACMQSDPQLEIYCDDVKCSHGATTGQLDERALFYMRSRGIPEDEARRMLVQAFIMDVVEAFSFDALRERMKMLVEKRLGAGGNPHSGSCADCSASCAK